MLRTADPASRGVEETRVRILTAVRELYAIKGSRGTTTREVAALAAVNEATLFRHFGTKQQLISAMLDYYNDGSQLSEALEHVGRFSTIDAQLHELGRSALDVLRRKEDLIKMSMAEELANPAGHLCAWRAPAATRERLTRYFREKVDSGELRGDAEWLARLFMSMFFSYVMARQLWAELGETSDHDAVATMIDLFLNGASAR